MRFSFKPLSKDDLPILYQWFEQPHVIEWWPVPKKGEEFFEHFLKRIRSKDTVPFLVLLDDKPLGYIQYYSISSEMRRWLPPLPEHSVGIDQFIGESENLGKGYGPAFVKAFIEQVLSKKDVATVIVDPETVNIRAIKSYEKAEFKRVGIYVAPYGTVLIMRHDINKSENS